MKIKEIKEILEVLENTAKNLEEIIFPTEDWKYFKFGRGGPYYHLLLDIQQKVKKYDSKLFSSFAKQSEIPLFATLIQVCLQYDGKEQIKEINIFRQQIKNNGNTVKER